MGDRIEGLHIRKSVDKYLEHKFGNRDVDLPDDAKLYMIKYKGIKHHFFADGGLLARNAENQTQCCSDAFSAMCNDAGKSYKPAEFLNAFIKDGNIEAAVNIVNAMWDAGEVGSVCLILRQTEHITAYKILANMDTDKACGVLRNCDNQKKIDILAAVSQQEYVSQQDREFLCNMLVGMNTRSADVEIAADVCSAIRMTSPKGAINIAASFILGIGLLRHDAEGIKSSGDAIVIFAKKNLEFAIDVAVALVADAAEPRRLPVLEDNIAAVAHAVAKAYNGPYSNGNSLAVRVVDTIGQKNPEVAIDVADRIVETVKSTRGQDDANLIAANIVSKIKRSNQELADKINTRIQKTNRKSEI